MAPPRAQETLLREVSDSDAMMQQFHAAGKHAEAIPYAEKALALRTQLLGEAHPDVATSMNNLAGLYWTTGRYVDAEPLAKGALAILKKGSARRTPRCRRSLEQTNHAV